MKTEKECLENLEVVTSQLQDSLKYLLTTPLTSEEDQATLENKLIQIRAVAKEYLKTKIFPNGEREEEEDYKQFDEKFQLAMREHVLAITREQNRVNIFNVILKILSYENHTEQNFIDIIKEADNFTRYSLKILEEVL